MNELKLVTSRYTVNTTCGRVFVNAQLVSCKHDMQMQSTPNLVHWLAACIHQSTAGALATAWTPHCVHSLGLLVLFHMCIDPCRSAMLGCFYMVAASPTWWQWSIPLRHQTAPSVRLMSGLQQSFSLDAFCGDGTVLSL